jgi:hypothetical protein
MRLVCSNQEWLAKYQEICSHRDLPFTPWPSRLALLAARGDDLVAGVMAYDTTGPFIFFQHLVTNPLAPIRARWAAVDLMAGEILGMCRMLNKLPEITVSSRGIAKILRRHGLQNTQAVLYSCAYQDLEEHDEPSPTPQYQSRPTHPPRAGKAPHRDTEDNPPLCPPVD